MQFFFSSLTKPSLQEQVPLLLLGLEGLQISFSAHSSTSRPTSQTRTESTFWSFIVIPLEVSNDGSTSNQELALKGLTSTTSDLFLSFFATFVLFGVIGKQYLSSLHKL